MNSTLTARETVCLVVYFAAHDRRLFRPAPIVSNDMPVLAMGKGHVVLPVALFGGLTRASPNSLDDRNLLQGPGRETRAARRDDLPSRRE